VISTRSTPRRRHARRRSQARHGRRLFALGLVVVVALVLGVRFLHSGGTPTTTPALANPPRSELAPAGPPHLEALASAPDGLVLDMPIAQGRITAVVYHGVGNPEALPLTPNGHQLNAGLLASIGNLLAGAGSQGPGYYITSGGSGGGDTGSVDVGAVAGTNVYSPVDGRIVSMRPYIINGKAWGSVIQIQPASAPAVILTITNIHPARSLTVGATVGAATSRLGTVADLSKAVQQVVANFTSDAGNHVHIEASQAPATAPIL
jgi:hypothetical protein